MGVCSKSACVVDFDIPCLAGSDMPNNARRGDFKSFRILVIWPFIVTVLAAKGQGASSQANRKRGMDTQQRAG